MFKKSQITPAIVITILLVIVGVFTLFLSLGGFEEIKDTQKKVEINNFVSTLENSLKSQKLNTVGSSKQFSLSLPSNIETVCFIDEKEAFSPESFLLLSKEKEIYKDKNLFFFPSEKFTPANIDYLKLDSSSNPLCVQIFNGKLNIKLTTRKDSTLVEASDKKDSAQDCIIVSGSDVGDPDEKVDIVFLGYGYDNKSFFIDDVNEYTNNYLFRIEPFLSNKDKFNIWMIDNKQPDCSITSYIFCDSLSVNKIASNCPNDHIFILADKSKVSSSVRSSAISNMIKINTKDNRLVLVHEFGHSFGGLADEYTDKYYESWFKAENYPNCDKSGCASWKSVNGTSCIKGCSTNEFYRSIPISIMRDYDKSDEYGLLNEMIIQEKLEVYR